MLDPETKPSPAREFAHKGKGCLAVLIALAVLVGGGYFAYDRARGYLTTLGEIPDYTGAGKGRITITVPEGASVDDIGGILVENDVIKSTKAWDKAVRQEERSTSIQAGRYVMRTQIPAFEALKLLINPGESRVRAQFTVREGLRLSAQIDELVKGTKIPKANFQKALAAPQSLGLPAYARNRPEGFLFPETYELTAGANATVVLRQMVDQYKNVAADIGLDAQAKRLGYSPYQVLIVASIIEREVANPAYRAKVARVLYNRLKKGQPLQLDSTVIYAKNLNTTTTTPQDRQSNSPYNTYKHPGLPPGPISAPGRAALEAAAAPENGKWLYFVTVNFDTGETRFAETFADHEKNVAAFQAWCQANKGRCT
ncbi:MAG TPA: endolytic transglycosylase MltG [Propionibacteriaceae bacterium]|nr:endolytic transglycosylase MltG [Propionibacteriaceae bacterium]